MKTPSSRSFFVSGMFFGLRYNGVMQKRAEELLKQRDTLRKRKDYTGADKTREEIEKLGFSVIDDQGKSRLFPLAGKTKERNSSIALFGSGETSSIGRKIHEAVLSRIGKKQITIAILTTPAGFQPNVRVVHEEIASFFKDSLANFHPKIRIVYANSEREVNDTSIVAQLDDADYIFIGPGSPTYAAKVLRNSVLYQRLTALASEGVSLGIASAAAIAFSKWTLPVYEIYKVGESPFWVDGLNFYATFFSELTVIPHFNNTEGGKKTDTSRCFMGRDRFAMLLELLPKGHTVWGIDEMTGVILGKSDERMVLGKGKLHVLR